MPGDPSSGQRCQRPSSTRSTSITSTPALQQPAEQQPALGVRHLGVVGVDERPRPGRRGWRRPRRPAARRPPPARPPRSAGRRARGRPRRATPKVSSTTESRGWKPSTTGTMATQVVGVRATKVEGRRAAGSRSCPTPSERGPTAQPTDGRRWTTRTRKPLWTRTGLPAAAAGRRCVARSPRALRADDPARRPRRLLRRRRAARQAVPAGQAGRRRRGRRPRRGRDRVLRGPRLRGPLGHAHRGGAPARARTRRS